MDCILPHADLKTVELRGIVAPGDHHPTLLSEMHDGKVEHRCGANTDIGNRHTTVYETFQEGMKE